MHVNEAKQQYRGSHKALRERCAHMDILRKCVRMVHVLLQVAG
jgi:hypothetical protein